MDAKIVSNILGGGQDWSYLIVDGKFKDASHRRDKEGMKRLEDELHSLTNDESDTGSIKQS